MNRNATKFSDAARCLRVLEPPIPGRREVERVASGEFVVLLHGLWRSVGAMEPLARRLHREGFHTLNLGYPSFRLPLDELLERTQERIARSAGGRPVHFLTHSMGGILARYLLERGEFEDPSRLLMLAPPNQGSAIIRYLEGSPMRHLLGPGGNSLHPEEIAAGLPDHAPESADTTVIAGTQVRVPFFQSEFEGANDGIVSVAETKLDGAKHALIRSDHTFIVADGGVARAAAEFLRDGKFDPARFGGESFG